MENVGESQSLQTIDFSLHNAKYLRMGLSVACYPYKHTSHAACMHADKL